MGRPDIAIKKYRVAVFVDGDMWHGNAWRLRKLRSLDEMFPTNTMWWVQKIERNQRRDRQVTDALEKAGWTVIRVWESDIQTSIQEACNRIAHVVNTRKVRFG
jgi:DNA mismatch endonuclease (patch repair protein)